MRKATAVAAVKAPEPEAQPQAQVEQEDPNRPVPQLMPQRRRLAEHARNHHVITVEDAKHPGDFLKPEFWALVAKEMQPGDRVDIQDDGLTFFGEYLVLACDATWAKLHALHIAELVPAKEQEISPDFKIEFKGPHLKYCVIRLSDNQIVHEAAATRIDANTWLIGYARTIGAKIGP